MLISGLVPWALVTALGASWVLSGLMAAYVVGGVAMVFASVRDWKTTRDALAEEAEEERRAFCRGGAHADGMQRPG